MKSGEYKPDVVNTNVNRLDSITLVTAVSPLARLLTLAAPTSCGKSALALYIAARTMIDQCTPTAYFSFEMPQQATPEAYGSVHIRQSTYVAYEQGHSKADDDIQAIRPSLQSRYKGMPFYTSH
jgi:hypothetical protein